MPKYPVRMPFGAVVILALAAAAFGQDAPPSAIKQAKPVYPAEVRGVGASGTVKVDFIVDAKGDVTGAKVASSTDKAFEVPALAAVKQWKFKPATKGGKAVATHMLVDIVFQYSAKDVAALILRTQSDLQKAQTDEYRAKDPLVQMDLRNKVNDLREKLQAMQENAKKFK